MRRNPSLILATILVLIGWVAPRDVKSGLDCPLIFESILVKDTILPSEAAYIEFSLSNRGDSSVLHTTLDFLCDAITASLVRDSDDWVVYCGCAHYCGGQTDSSRLEPGRSIHHSSKLMCPDRLQPGSYRVVLQYAYDPWGDSTCNGARYLKDTVQLTVKAENPSDSSAFEAFLSARSSPDEEQPDAYWKILQEHRNTDYRGLVSYYLAIRQCAGKPSPLPSGVTAANLILEVYREIPHDEAVKMVINCHMARLGKRQQRNLRRELLDSLN